MRDLGIVILVIGFLWFAVDATSGFTTYQHALWVKQSQGLPNGELVPRADSVAAMRELALSLGKRQRATLVPAFGMLLGGVLVFFAGSVSKKSKKELKVSGDI